MIKQKRDANEKYLVMIAQALGAMVIHMDRSAGFDLLVVTQDGVRIVEIKDPAQYWHLTLAEAQTRLAVKYAGGEYYLVETQEEMVGLVRNDRPVMQQILLKGDGRGKINQCA